MFKNQVVKNVLFALAVAVFGFVLLDLAFILDFLFQSVVIWFVKLFTADNPPMDWPWFAPVMHALFMVLIGFLSWFVFRLKLGVFYKAIYLTVPLAVVFATIGIALYRWPLLSYSLGGLVSIGILYCFYRTKQSWIYYYVVILVSLILAIFSLLGGEI